MSKSALVATLSLLSLATLSNNAFAAAGRTQGSFAVSNTGAATYTIPIWTPPGVRGLQPSLALVYSSNASNGLLGVGWNLAGFSTISRCNNTYAQDSVTGSPQLDSNDKFCIDGNRLRVTSGVGTYGVDGSTYQTEIANFSNVIAHGASGSGPSWFEVKAKNGLTFEYGHSSDSAILASDNLSVRTWALNTVRDRTGNSMTFTYNNDVANGSYRPAGIQYTSTGGSASNYNYQILFNYQSRPTADDLWTYTIGGKNNELNALYQVLIQSNNGGWSTIKSYTLNYQSSPTTQRLRIQNIQECAGSDCLAPTVISYQDGQAGWGSEISQPGDLTTGVAFPVDINGDGIDDLVYADANSGQWYYMLGTTSGAYQGPYASGVSTTAGYTAAVPIDYNADGKMDVLVPNASGNWSVMYFQSAGAPFSNPDTGIPATGASPGMVKAIDIDGDGRTDLMYGVSGGSGWASTDTIYYRLNTSSGLSTTENVFLTLANCPTCSPFTKFSGTGSPFPPPSASFGSASRKPDFNGDGREDFLVLTGTCNADRPAQCGNSSNPIIRHYTLYLSQPNGSYIGLPLTSYSQWDQSAFSAPLFGDFNGDGCTDIAFTTGGVWQLQFGTCYRNGAGDVLTAPVNTGIPYAGTPAVAIDWDGDGRTDIVQGNPSEWGVLRSNGATLGAWTDIGIPYPTSAFTSVFVADANGDGLDDLVYRTSSGGSPSPLFTRIHSGTMPDLATAFTDGFGVNTTVSYVALTQSNYTKYSDATFPDIDYLQPDYVVSGTTSSTGISSPTTFSQSFLYYGAHKNLQGRGFEGFYAKRTYDSRTGFYLYDYFKRDFPYTGMPMQSDLYQSDIATLISHATNGFDLKTLDGSANNQRYFPFVNQSSRSAYEFAGVKNGQLTSTTNTSFAYDNYGNATNVSTTVTDNDSSAPTSPYYGQSWTTTTATSISPDTGNWCLGLPSSITVTNSAPGVPNITRTVSFPSPDYANCRENQKITEPSSGTYAVTEAYAYDGFGNVNSVTTTGAGMVARITSTNWGSRGQFPMSVTNPMYPVGNPSAQTTSMGYDFNLGLQTSTTDPNGIQTIVQYDAFGRKVRETRPDGTYTIWTYVDCVNTGGCLVGNHAMVITQTAYKSDGSILTNASSYLDPFDRPLIDLKENIAGGYDRNEVSYDALGRVSQRAMPCAWSGVTAACSYWTTYNYDSVNRETSESRPINTGSPTTLQTTTIQYQGRTTIVTDPQGKQTTKITTVAGTLGRSQDHNGYYQNFTYDAFGNLLTVTDSLSNTLSSNVYAYGISAFKIGMTDMDLGSWGYVQNALGEVGTYTDANGATFSLTYDALSRPLTRSVTGEGTTTWTWGNSAAAFNIGQLQSISKTGASTESYTYDSAGRLTNRHIVSDAAYDYDYTYNSTTGLLDTLTYPTSTSSYRLKLQYNYQYGILNQVKDFNSPTTVFWQANSTNSRGQITQETLGGVLVTNRSFDAVTGWLGSIQCGIGGGTCAQNQSYLYDEVGNLTQRQNNNLGLTENFFYDNLYRLDHSTLQAPSGTSTNLSLTYDAMGNILTKSDVAGGATWTYSPTHKHQVTQAGNSNFTYSYDANGNAVTRNGLGITWSKYNYPTVINGNGESTSLFYDANNARWKQVYTKGSGVETTIYVGGQLEKVTSGGVDDYRHYISANGQAVAIMSRTTSGSNTTRYLLRDGLGSVTKIADNSGVEVVSESFTAFGTRRNPQTWSGVSTNGDQVATNGVTRQGFTGQDALGNLGLNHMNGRVQDAITGRFLSADPTIPEPGNTQSYNRYSYVRNNPLSFTDPTGFKDKEQHGNAGGMVDCGPCTGDTATRDRMLHGGEAAISDYAFAGATVAAPFCSFCTGFGVGGVAQAPSGNYGGPRLIGWNVTKTTYEEDPDTGTRTPVSSSTRFVPVQVGLSLTSLAPQWRQGGGGRVGVGGSSGPTNTSICPNCHGTLPDPDAITTDGDRKFALSTFGLLASSLIPAIGIEALGAEGLAAITDVELVQATAASSRYVNIAVNLNSREFQANLLSNGYKLISQTVGPNGPVTLLGNGVKTYSIYTATSTGELSALVRVGSQTMSKIRLTGP